MQKFRKAPLENNEEDDENSDEDTVDEDLVEELSDSDEEERN